MAGKWLFHPCFCPLTLTTSEARPKVLMTNLVLWGDSWSHCFLKASHLTFGAPEGIEGRCSSHDPSQCDSRFSVCKGQCDHLICLSWQAVGLPDFQILLLSAITFKCLGLRGFVELALISSLRATFPSIPGDPPGAKQLK